MKIDEKVKFLGFKENPYKYLKQADVLVQSSIYEGLPTVLNRGFSFKYTSSSY